MISMRGDLLGNVATIWSIIERGFCSLDHVSAD